MSLGKGKSLENLSNQQMLNIMEAVNPFFWAQMNEIQLVAGPFTLEGHEYQADIMTDPHNPRMKVVMKATQMAFTETFVLDVLHSMIHRKYPQGALYMFPTKDDVTDFSQSRFAPLITNNRCIGDYIQDTDRANLKRIGGGFLYFRSGKLSQEIRKSMKASSKLLSIPVDHCVFDEYDAMDQAAEDWAENRMAHSNIKTKVFLANPTIPDYGVDAKFQLTDQNFRFIKCEHCGEWTCLEEEFPKCVYQAKDGHWFRACKKCGREIFPYNSQWVPKHPDRSDEAMGWHISHLNSVFIDPGDVLKKYRDPNTRIGPFTRLVLGRAYIESENRLDLDQIYALCGDKGFVDSDKGPCYMGIDQHGDTSSDKLYVVIGKKHPRAFGEHIRYGIYGWDDLDTLMRKFHVSRCVIDAMPEVAHARAFACKYPGKVWMCFYIEHQKGSYAWNEQELTVKCNRTESLDNSQEEVLEEGMIFPKCCEMTELFATHLNNVAKRLEEDEETGSKRYVYIMLHSTVGDHFRHAYNYECMARQNAPEYVFDELH